LEGLGGRVPIVVVPPGDELDRPSDHLPTEGRRRSAASAIQDWLNANQVSLWGFCSNGFRLRLVRDNVSLTRPAYIDADLHAIFQEENFADFTTLWLLVHASRFGQPGTLPSDCALERWRQTGQKEGVAARDRLRDGVEAALLSFGNGFLAHPDNGALRDKLRSGEVSLTAFFGATCCTRPAPAPRRANSMRKAIPSPPCAIAPCAAPPGIGTMTGGKDY
jgi:hypothetical protein